MIALPSWLPEETWTAFIAMRKQIKKPATDFAQTLLLKTLYKLRDSGHDPLAALEQSIVNCWTGIFPAKDAGLIPQPAARQLESFRERDERIAREKYEEAVGIRRRVPATEIIEEVPHVAPLRVGR